MTSLRPAEVCRRLLEALDASEGRRRRRKRDTTPDAIGLSIKRGLLEAAIREDPGPEEFEGWLLEQALAAGGAGATMAGLPIASAPAASRTASGPIRAMALDVLAEWRLAETSPAFRRWLESGARSADTAREDPGSGP